jgi:hypothetical protein
LAKASNTLRFRCPKLPHYQDARIGVRRETSNSNEIEKILGYNAVITTAINPLLGLELPVTCIPIAGNAEEGNKFISLQRQILRFNEGQPLLHVLDGKYNEFLKYEYARQRGAVALINYNKRKKSLISSYSLKKDTIKMAGHSFLAVISHSS